MARLWCRGVRSPRFRPAVRHSCGLRIDGSIVCWGNNYDGQAEAPGGSFTQVSAGGYHSCGLRIDGSIVCWGNNRYGQAEAPGGSFTQVSASGRLSCGVRADGSIVCWGDNRYGQAVVPGGSFTQVSTGDSHSCGVRADGSIVCWGNNDIGEAEAPGGSFTQVSAGDLHSCGVRTDGSIVCWGLLNVELRTVDGGVHQPTIDRFTDVDGNTHEEDINRIAQLGITVGCATQPEARYCPDAHVTRAQMAAFLLRSIGQPNPQANGVNPFSDVPEDVWSTKYALRLAQMGVDTGENGEWRPNDPLTRLEMAQWLTQMFDHITPATSPQGLFGDVDSEHWAVVEGLYHVGVTKGCSAQPLLYCADQSVTRAQMASFIIRALP